MTGANLSSTRQRLPNRRGSEAFVLEAGGLSFAAVVRFDDESLGKVFLRRGRPPRLRDEDGAVVFAELGLEGIVSKRAGSFCRCGRSRNWLKAKNPDFVST
jgi:hypothetical protein